MSIVDLSTLPANAQQELRDFYEFLQKKYVDRQSKPADFKTYLMTIPKTEDVDFVRQRDFPKDLQL